MTYRTHRARSGAHHILTGNYIDTGKVLCGRVLDPRRQVASLAPTDDLDVLVLHAKP